MSPERSDALPRYPGRLRKAFDALEHAHCHMLCLRAKDIEGTIRFLKTINPEGATPEMVITMRERSESNGNSSFGIFQRRLS